MEVVEEDILLEIFSRLPKKSRLRCSAVSKTWQNLIGKTASFSARPIDSGFVYQEQYYHMGFTTRPVEFYRLDDKGSLLHFQDNSLLFPDPAPHGPVWRHMGSCNGFLFFAKRSVVDMQNPWKPDSINLYNPVTKQLTVLPPLPFSDEEGLVPTAMGLAPDSRNKNNHYKFLVACLRYSRTRWRCHRVAIFDSKTGEWKVLRKDMGTTLVLGAATLYRGGRFYWLQASNLRVFSMKTETFRRIRLPGAVCSAGVMWESEGGIHFCKFSEIRGLCIWALEDEYSGVWKEIYSVDMKTLNSILARDIGPVVHHGTTGGSCSRIERVCGFNEHLQILHLQTSCLGVLGYDISGKTMTLVSPCYSPQDDKILVQLPFTYNDMELPNIIIHEDDEPESATSRRSRKRSRSPN